MVQILNLQQRPNRIAETQQGLGQAMNAAMQFNEARRQENQLRQENAAAKQLGINLEGINDPKMRQITLQEGMKALAKERQIQQKNALIGETLSGKSSGASPQVGGALSQGGMSDYSMQPQVDQQAFDPSKYSDDEIAKITALDPNVGRSLQHAKDVKLREDREFRKSQEREFQNERAYHTQFSKDTEKEVENMRNSLPKLEMALDYSRNAVESGELDFFSKDKLADITGVDAFRTAKGAQLVTAGKENLLGNMSRVSARAQNIWFEQRLNSMFPKIGQSREANLTVQEMIEGEAAMNKAYISEFDRISEEDQQKYGFVKKDANKRAREAVKPVEKEILKRSAFRMKEIEEQEQGLSSLKKQVGKNVVKDTPLTLAMMTLYADKYGVEKGLAIAKKNGYYVPSLEEFKVFQARPQEFREQVAQ